MKYIIELEDEPINGLYKAKNFNTLVFDQNGLDRLEKINPSKLQDYYNKTNEPNLYDEVICYLGNTKRKGIITNIFSNEFYSHKKQYRILLGDGTFVSVLRSSFDLTGNNSTKIKEVLTELNQGEKI